MTSFGKRFKTLRRACDMTQENLAEAIGVSIQSISKWEGDYNMPVVSSTYWNSIHGNSAEEAGQDLEGLQVMRNLAHNMSFMVKAIALGKEKYGMPEIERKNMTNFIR